jgi:hypothetical protein
MATYDARPSAFTQLSTTSEWEYLLNASSGGVSGIDMSVGSAMIPSLDTGGRNAVIADGIVVIKGQLWRCDAPVNTPIPAASAQNRIDRLVIRLTRGATTSPTVVQPVVITGTPSGSPVKPPIVQTTTGIYDIPVSSWTSTSAGAITTLFDERQIANDVWHDMRPLISSFVGSISGEFPPQYKMDAVNGVVLVVGSVQLPGSGSYNSIPFFAVPNPYLPSKLTAWAAAQAAGAMNTDSSSGSPRVFIDSTNQMQLGGISPTLNGTIVRINGFYPMQGYNGLIQT